MTVTPSSDPDFPMRGELREHTDMLQQAAEAWYIHAARADEPQDVPAEVEVLWAGWFNHRHTLRTTSVGYDVEVPLVVMRAGDLVGAMALDSTDVADAETWSTWMVVASYALPPEPVVASPLDLLRLADSLVLLDADAPEELPLGYAPYDGAVPEEGLLMVHPMGETVRFDGLDASELGLGEDATVLLVFDRRDSYRVTTVVLTEPEPAWEMLDSALTKDVVASAVRGAVKYGMQQEYAPAGSYVVLDILGTEQLETPRLGTEEDARLVAKVSQISPDGVQQCISTVTYASEWDADPSVNPFPFGCATPVEVSGPAEVAPLITAPVVSARLVRAAPDDYSAGRVQYVSSPDVTTVEITYEGEVHSLPGGFGELPVEIVVEPEVSISATTQDGTEATVYGDGCLEPDDDVEQPVIRSSNC